MMKRFVPALAAFALSSSASAASNTYQVTGPVLELTDTTIVVQKGKERWELARDGVKAIGNLKVGAKVTVEYRMVATRIEAKGGTPQK